MVKPILEMSDFFLITGVRLYRESNQMCGTRAVLHNCFAFPVWASVYEVLISVRGQHQDGAEAITGQPELHFRGRVTQTQFIMPRCKPSIKI